MHYRSHHRRPVDSSTDRRRHPRAVARRRRSSLEETDASLFAPPFGRSGFLAAWLDGLEPLLRTWLLASVRREAIARAEDDAGEPIEECAADVLLEACAEAHDLTQDELHWLIPTIEEECKRYVRDVLRFRRRPT